MGNIFGGPEAPPEPPQPVYREPPQPVYREPDPYPAYDIPLYREGLVRIAREVRARPRCRQYERGTCNYGANCRFAHDGPVVPWPRKPCRFFAKGSCHYGSGCKFSHEAPSEEDDGDGEVRANLDTTKRAWMLTLMRPTTMLVNGNERSGVPGFVSVPEVQPTKFPCHLITRLYASTV